jgi:hypothetical protein
VRLLIEAAAREQGGRKMRRTILALGWLVLLSVSSAAAQQEAPGLAPAGPQRPPPEVSCPRSSIRCGATVHGAIEAADCELSRGLRGDVYGIEVPENQFVTIRLSSSEFDTYLAFREGTAPFPTGAIDYRPPGNFFDDNGGGGTNSLVAVEVGRADVWLITARGRTPGSHGQYLLEIACDEITCQMVPSAVCVTRMRFRVEAHYIDSSGERVGANPGRQSPEKAFFRMSRGEVDAEVAVLDRCAENGYFWVTAEAHVGDTMSIQVTDTKTGTTKVYENKPGEPFAAVADREAFPCR